MRGLCQDRWILRGAEVLASVLYLGSFTLPDYRVWWATGPGGPGVAGEMFFFTEMICTPPREWRDAIESSDVWQFLCALVGWGDTGWWWSRPLDWVGWYGHIAAVTGLGLLVMGRGRGASIAATIGLGLGVLRVWTLDSNAEFAGGYYLWLASMMTVGAAGGLHWWARADRVGLGDPAPRVASR